MIDAAARGLAAKALTIAKPTIAGRVRVGLMGDSITADCLAKDLAASPPTSKFTNWGWGAWFRRYTLGKLDLPDTRIYATGGFTIQNIIDTWLPVALADKPDVVIVHCGTNSLAGDSSANLKAQLKRIYDSLHDAGIFVVAIPIRAHKSPNVLSGTALLQLAYLNNYIRRYAATNAGMIVVDVNPSYIDFSTGNVQSTYLRDGIHDNQVSAQMMGKLLATAVLTLMPGADTRFIHLGDVYDATYNPTGNLLANGLMAGTSGSLANGATGTPPTSWRGLRSGNSGSALAFTNESYPNVTGLNKIVMTASGTADGSLIQIDQTVSSNIAAGDVLEAEVEVDYTITTGAFAGLGLFIRFLDGGSATLAEAWDGYYSSGNGTMTAGSDNFVLRTPPFTAPAGTASVLYRVVAAPPTTGTVDALFKVSRASLRKVL